MESKRMCVICRRHMPKADLIAYVGKTLDSTGKVQARHWYLCSDPKCKEKAIKANKISE